MPSFAVRTQQRRTMQSRARALRFEAQQTSPTPLMTREKGGGTKRLLAIDDDPDAAQLIIKIANKCGYLGRSVSDTHDIRNVLKEWRPDILTLDLCMPQEDGFEILLLLQEVEFVG